MNRLIIPIFIPFQGCPERCIYCDQATITGKKDYSSLPSKNTIEEEIERYLTYTKNKREIEIAFYGGTFTALPSEKQEFLLKTARDNDIQKPSTMRISTHPSYISQEILQRLKHFGVVTVELGVQSMEKNVLKNLHRDYSSETVSSAITLLKKNGFLVGSQLMAGCPGETSEGYMSGITKLVDVGTDFFRLYPLQVFSGTALEGMLKKKALILPDVGASLRILENALIALELKNKPAIRVGLPESGIPSTSPLQDPSLKHRLLSQIALKIMQESIRQIDKEDHLTIIVNEKKLPEYIGYKKENIITLNTGIKAQNIRIQCDNRRNFDEISLETKKGGIMFSRRELLTIIYRNNF